MPKVDNKITKGAAARAAAHPLHHTTRSSSSKKKKTSSSSSSAKKKKLTSHSASLGDELNALSNPGKLKPIRGKDGVRLPQTSVEEQKLEDELLGSARAKMRAAKGRPARPTAASASMDDSMEDDTAGDYDDDDEADAEAEMLADESHPLTARESKKILAQAHAQQREEEDQEGEEEERRSNNASRRLKQISLSATVDGDDDMSEVDEDDDEDHDEEQEDDQLEDIELSPEDAASLEMWMPKSTGKTKSLGDMILEKVREKEAQLQSGGSHGNNIHFGPGFGVPVTQSQQMMQQQQQDANQVVREKLDPKIVEVYTKVGKFLSHYTSGKIPKAFKLIPNLKSWEEILYLTQPEAWSCQAYFVATRIFSSNFNPKMAQRFYSLILLPKIRNDIESNKHLNYHLYQSIKKALYKTAAFFKGLLLPLAEEGSSLREAVIMSSILAKCTIPVLHSAVALIKLTQIPYSGTTALFIRTLLNKKYSLPKKVVSALVQYFCGFTNKNGVGSTNGGHGANDGSKTASGMPLIWHQTLLIFVQRYKLVLTANQVTALKNLIKVQQHHSISQEIRRELAAINGATQQKLNQTNFQFSGMNGLASFNPTAFPSSSSSSSQQPLQTQTQFVFGTTPGFQSLAAAIKNPVQFNLPIAAPSAMEQ